MSASPSYESAYRPGRLQFVRETTAGTYVTDPAYEFFSDVVRSFEATIDPQVEGQRGLGDPDVQAAFAGSNADEVTLSYDLQQKAAGGNTLHDGSGNPNDAITDAFERDTDNRINNTHQIVRRKDQSGLTAAETVNGSTSRDTRQYVVATGAYPNEGTLTGDPTDGQPILAEITYLCESVRTYQVDQPTSSESPIELWANSTDSSDTGITVTLENEDAGTTEDLSLDGTDATTDVQTTATFSDVDAIELSGEAVGDVRIYVDDGTGTAKGDQIATIYGQDSHDTGEGDLGIPALASGSNASAIGQDYELYHDDAIDRPTGTAIAQGFETTELSVSNNVAQDAQGGSARPALSAGDREIEASITVFGETERHDHTVDLITTDATNLRFDFDGPTDGGHIQLDSAFHTEVTASESVGDSKMMSDLTLGAQGVTISA